MRNVVLRLIAEEFRARDPADSRGRAAFRACEKLRGPLSTLVGIVGFRSLLSRALTLAKAKVPWLGGVQINPEGPLEFPAAVEAQLQMDEAAEGGAALIAELLGLLVTFIGEDLTLRFVQGVWPKAALSASESGED
jgi:hypothetical protein